MPGKAHWPACRQRSTILRRGRTGDLVAILETPEGALITSREALATRMLDRIGELLRAEGFALDELIESGREERGRLVETRYGSIERSEPS